jgi:hypothetical protein
MVPLAVARDPTRARQALARRRVDHGARELVEACAQAGGHRTRSRLLSIAERQGLGAAATGRARDPVVARLAVRLEHTERTENDFAWATAAEHCRLAWLRGRFLARGSLSLAGGTDASRVRVATR